MTHTDVYKEFQEPYNVGLQISYLCNEVDFLEMGVNDHLGEFDFPLSYMNAFHFCTVIHSCILQIECSHFVVFPAVEERKSLKCCLLHVLGVW